MGEGSDSGETRWPPPGPHLRLDFDNRTMDDSGPAHNSNAAPMTIKAKDPVCGMDVNPEAARHKALHQGKEYYFCCASCLAKFQANPEKILSSPPQPMAKTTRMTSGLATLDAPSGASANVPSRELAAVVSAHQKPARSEKDTRHYVCPMCPEVRKLGPGPCPKCGMALDHELPPLPAKRTEFTCPMHPEIVRAAPGSCPICGMTLEPRTITIDEENPELRDMTRRFWIGLALTAPLLAIAMGSMLWPRALMGGIAIHRGNYVVGTPWSSILPWLELLLATPVVLWCGWPFFQRGWASVVNRSTNMFTLIAMGTGVAYLFSVVATLLRRRSFPGRSAGWAASRCLLRSRSRDRHARTTRPGAGAARPQPNLKRNPGAARSKPKDGARARAAR
jgi:Cu+-exporting ATPase